MTLHRIDLADDRQGTLVVPVTTLTLWLGFLAVGALGFGLSYARPAAPVEERPAVTAEMLRVELTGDPPPPEDVVAPPELAPPPPSMEPAIPPPPPSRIQVAEPTAAIAFVPPVQGPEAAVESEAADYARPDPPAGVVPALPPPVQGIVYGRGEGRQPAPDYPRRAIREGQEGAVTVRFSVGETGRVLAAEAVSPSLWPLLNEAALRVVRERWRFRSGSIRIYEVTIRFELEP